ncbi:MAG TPA: MCP four helix bundle domain-containing protein, partial [Ramlibacter sp.]|nr:MCP four helix bundle domain-containing protein [Ramlibacter sp.]
MSNLKIGTRMGVGFAVLLGLMAVIVAIGVLQLQGVGEASRAMVRGPVARERLAQEWLRETATNSARTVALVKSNEPALVAQLMKSIREGSAVISATQK